MNSNDGDVLAKALYAALGGLFQSPNELDLNGETANVVDGLFALARSLDRVASALNPLPMANA